MMARNAELPVHPSTDTLALYSAGDLPFITRLRVGRHIGGCGDCEQVLLFRSATTEPRIAANTAIDFLRSNKKFAFVDVSQLADSTHSQHENPEQSLLRDVEDMPADQVAPQMNCSMATVRSHIANARTKFKRYLEARKSS